TTLTPTPAAASAPSSAGAPPGPQALASSSGGGPPRPPTPTPTPPPDCGQTGIREDAAPAGYGSDPRGAEGQNHPVFGTSLTTLADRDAFRMTLPAGTSMVMVNDAIARGCSPAWIQSHLESFTTITARP